MHSSSFQNRRLGQRKKSSTSRIVGIFFVILMSVFFCSYFFIKSTGSLELIPKNYIIDKGTTLLALPKILKLDISGLRYSLWIRFFAPKNITLQAWTYEVPRAATLSVFFEEILSKPKHTDLTITILPGWNIYDIDNYLVEKKIAKAWDFVTDIEMNFDIYKSEFSFLEWKTSLEGFLYPDTYRLKASADVGDVVKTLLSGFQKKIGTSYQSLGNRAYEKLILASIVEREERNTKNQRIVAGILEKRKNEWIALWADATVCTGYAKVWKDCTSNFIASVINEDNPYNTRKKQGYPPTPISSIDISSWDAAINPESSPYYYYLHDADGGIHYGKTLDDHVANKRKYLQ